MALYNYKCTECESVVELSRSIAQRDSVENEVCPECASRGKFERMVGSPLVGYSTTIKGSYGSKVPDGFKDLLKRINIEAGAKGINNSSYL